ncbi:MULTISPECIES: glycosyltransferase [Streptomyces]|uniref:D-inositol 3-phosphate glycosyltransferase n=2 Tax=Streptomyces TaxID=1883 RepID=A0A5P2BD68_STRVZ|nr:MULTISPECIES: glycosyltransferase [Streptomyces]MYY80513.1 glycosyltransferase [Streptomyces sp. SID335]MYZ15228.1 glycosyltransferase [Streptomyces sp. SID337]NEB43217.1 glycosyltransferase [Streptomyces sp. SID339]QES28455.1 glycosyl transferase [Streptomyces venezuelae]
MRVLHIITGLGVGGAEQQLRLMLRHLPTDSDVVALTNAGTVAQGIAADGIRVTDLGMSGNRDLAALPRLVRIIRAGRYDVVHTHLYRACLYGRIAARMAGVRAVVATEHSLGDSQMEGRPLTAGVRALYLAGERLGRVTVAVSPAVGARLHRWGVPRQRIRVVPNGIEVERFRFDPASRAHTRRHLRLPDGAFVVGGVGRLAAGKRFDVLLRAAAQLPDDVVVVLVGSGPEEPELRRLADRLGLGGRVRFVGESTHEESRGQGADVPDLPSLLSAMDALASPSPEEAFGLALVEGLASGLPVLYASCPAVEGLDAAERSGAAYCPSDPDSFARALHGLRGDVPPHREAPAAVRHYSISRSAGQLMDVYASVAPGPTLEVTPR